MIPCIQVVLLRYLVQVYLKAKVFEKYIISFRINIYFCEF